MQINIFISMWRDLCPTLMFSSKKFISNIFGLNWSEILLLLKTWSKWETSKYYPFFLKFRMYMFYITDTRGVRKVCKNFKFYFWPYKTKSLSNSIPQTWINVLMCNIVGKILYVRHFVWRNLQFVAWNN